MSVRNVFGLIVRVMGLALVLFGLLDLASLPLHLMGLSARPDVKAPQLAAAAVTYLVTGVAVICLANLITRLVYGRPPIQADQLPVDR